MNTIAKYILYFIFYSALGGIAETLYRLATEHQLYGVHGFLHLPILPIYGVGALMIIVLLSPRIKHPAALFVLAALLASIVEFVAHWLIEVIFGVWIWGYENNSFNLFGRVSLISSIAFGFAALLIVYLIHPRLVAITKRLPKKVIAIAATILGGIVLVDIVISVVQRLS